MSRFVPVDRQTGYLLPPSVEDWLPEDHLARFVVEVIEQLDLPELSLRFIGLTQKAARERGNELLQSDVNPERRGVSYC
ncbi:hypothetical protein R69746_08785 [Paraburkholderia aspalathi]|nr:hypothetical protein [Paraburkholderia aspalathi]MBK3844657.1 hypothetical protein [Paraburkholderia aspalathi]CAE6875988.1 hypothetical protein R69746_08785 [Paraburkholderia aspalathi]